VSCGPDVAQMWPKQGVPFEGTCWSRWASANERGMVDPVVG